MKYIHSILLLFCMLLGAGCDPDGHNTVIEATSICTCAREGASISNPCFLLNRNWEHTVGNLMGVSAFDFENNGNVGTQCEGETLIAKEWQAFYFNSWRPVTGFKENVVGTLH